LYYRPHGVDKETIQLMNLIDVEFTRHPFYGTRRMTKFLKKLGYEINRKRTQRLYIEMGLETIYPKKNLSQRNLAHPIFPYLLKGLDINRANQVWCSDLTYIRLKHGFVYLVAIMDWFSRYVLGWKLSISLEADFCIEILNTVLLGAKCNIFNSDQGSQFTTPRFTNILLSHGIQVSMDGKGRVFDNIFVERLWRSVKYECIYPMDFSTVKEAEHCLGIYFNFYNHERLHQSLGYRAPAELYFAGGK
jgi:putative transposase